MDIEDLIATTYMVVIDISCNVSRRIPIVRHRLMVVVVLLLMVKWRCWCPRCCCWIVPLHLTPSRRHRCCCCGSWSHVVHWSFIILNYNTTCNNVSPDLSKKYFMNICTYSTHSCKPARITKIYSLVLKIMI